VEEQGQIERFAQGARMKKGALPRVKTEDIAPALSSAGAGSAARWATKGA